MGNIVSSLKEVSDRYERYIYLFKAEELSGIARDLLDSFNEYATRMGSKSVIIMPAEYKKYNTSMYEELQRDPWFKDVIGDPHELPAGYVISIPGLENFRASESQAFIYVSGQVINLAYKNRIELSQDIVAFFRYNDTAFISNILEYSRASLFKPGSSTDSLLEKLRNAVILEPNINGIGFRVKPLKQALESAFSKRNDDTPVYDCVVYRF